MQKTFIISIAAAALLLVIAASCGRGGVSSALDDIDSYIQERPDSALTILQAIDTASLRTRSQKAKFSLLYAMALDKNNIDNGSLLYSMLIAATHYQHHGTNTEKKLAQYYLADQYYDGRDPNSALTHFFDALGYAQKEKDWYICGMCCRSLGFIFNESLNFEQEISYCKEACDFFEKAGKGLHAKYSKIDLAGAYLNSRQMDKAKSLYDETILSAREDRDTSRLIISLKSSLPSCLYIKRSLPDSVIARMSQIITLGGIPDYKLLQSWL